MLQNTNPRKLSPWKIPAINRLSINFSQHAGPNRPSVHAKVALMWDWREAKSSTDHTQVQSHLKVRTLCMYVYYIADYIIAAGRM